MVSFQTAISPAEEEEEKKKPCVRLESRTVVLRKRKLSARDEEEKRSHLFCKSAKKVREEEGRGGVMELNLLGAHPELKSKRKHSKVDPKSLEVTLDLNLELNLSCTPSKMGCLSDEEEERATEEEIEEMVATVCLRCHMLVMMTKVALLCPNCKFVHSPDQSSSLALIKPV